MGEKGLNTYEVYHMFIYIYRYKYALLKDGDTFWEMRR
jgi:hypothetical protein